MMVIRAHQRRLSTWLRHRKTAQQMCAVLLVASVFLVTQPLHAQLSVVRPMKFGLLLPGISRTIPPTSGDAAQWRYEPLLTLLLNAKFTLPTSLSGGSGTEPLPISFCTTCGIYRINTDNPSGGITFNPENGVHNLTVTLLSKIYFWIGGTISPTASQPAGQYSGTIILTITIL